MEDGFSVHRHSFDRKQDCLIGQWSNRFQLKRDFKQEAILRDIPLAMLPSKSLDTAGTVETVPFLRTVYYPCCFGGLRFVFLPVSI